MPRDAMLPKSLALLHHTKSQANTSGKTAQEMQLFVSIGNGTVTGLELALILDESSKPMDDGDDNTPSVASPTLLQDGSVLEELVQMKRTVLSIGSFAPDLFPITLDGSLYVFAACDRPSVIYGAEGQLRYLQILTLLSHGTQTCTCE